jgi:hypothetical protein
MPTTTDNLSDLGQLNTDVRTIARQFDELAEQLLDRCDRIGKAVQWARATIEADLRQGVEARQLARSLATFKEYGADVLQVYALAKKEFADRNNVNQTLAPLIKEAEAFVRWIDDLLALANRTHPPIDEELLRERARQCDEAKAWVSSDDARARLNRGG